MNVSFKSIFSQQQWEEFFYELSPQTFLQTWEWGVFQEKLGEKIFRLGIFLDGRLEGIALILLISARRGRFLFCPHGPLFRKLERQREREILSAFTEYLKKIAKAYRCHFIRLSPLFPTGQGYEELFAAMKYRPAPIHMMHPEISWILDVSPDEETLLSQMRKSTRYSIRKAMKDGVKVFKSNSPQDLQHFWRIYLQTVSRQHFSPFSLRYLKEEFCVFQNSNRVALIFGKYGEDLVSAAFCIFTRHCGFYHHGASTQEYPKLTASHLVLWEAIREAKRRECRFFNFWGVVREDQKNHPWAGLSLFKRGFGGFSESYIHAQDLPLSWRYAGVSLVETLRRWKRGL